MTPVLAHIGSDVDGVVMLGLPALLLVVFTLLERRARKAEREAESNPDSREGTT